MIKTVLSGSFDFDDALASIVPLHRAGVDSGWMNKRAAAEVFNFDDYTPRKGETLVHLLALGDGETVGCNRNGDYFPKKANQDYHHTFLTANYYHNHDNKDKDKAYGRVVAAAHNGRMGRVELIVGLDNEKAADDIDELDKKGEFPVSMSARVPFDICSICGNKAKSRKEYCKHASLTMGKIMDDGKQACVINDFPSFFDISKVFRGADRVAWTFQKLDKAAAAGNTLGGAELAELLMVAEYAVPIVKAASPASKELVWRKLAKLVAKPSGMFREAGETKTVAAEDIEAIKSANDRRDVVFNAMHDFGICLPLDSFAKVAGIDIPPGVTIRDIQSRTLGLLESANDSKIKSLCENGSYDGRIGVLPSKVACVLANLRATHSLLPDIAIPRLTQLAAKCGISQGKLEKSACHLSPEVDVVADEYAAYLLSFAYAAGQANLEHAGFIENLTALRALG